MDTADVITHTTGLDLLVARRRAGLRQRDVAAAMGVSRPRVAFLEAMYAPPEPAVERYMTAVRTARREAA